MQRKLDIAVLPGGELNILGFFFEAELGHFDLIFAHRNTAQIELSAFVSPGRQQGVRPGIQDAHGGPGDGRLLSRKSKALQSYARYRVRVRLLGRQGRAKQCEQSEYSSPAFQHAGPLFLNEGPGMVPRGDTLLCFLHENARLGHSKFATHLGDTCWFPLIFAR